MSERLCLIGIFFFRQVLDLWQKEFVMVSVIYIEVGVFRIFEKFIWIFRVRVFFIDFCVYFSNFQWVFSVVLEVVIIVGVGCSVGKYCSYVDEYIVYFGIIIRRFQCRSLRFSFIGSFEEWLCVVIFVYFCRVINLDVREFCFFGER